MKKYIFALILLAVIVGIAAFFETKIESFQTARSPRDLSYTQIPLTIASTTFMAFVSDTPDLRVRGLSNFSPLANT